MLIGYRDSLPVHTSFRNHHENHRRLEPVMRGRQVTGFKEVLADVNPPANGFLPPVFEVPKEVPKGNGFGWLEYSKPERRVSRAERR